MLETEIKILEISEQEMLPRLRQLEAVRHFAGCLQAVYYDTPAKDLSRSRKILRLRFNGAKSMITYKEQLDSATAKKMHETETEVSDFNAARQIITGLGFQPWLDIAKERCSYKLGRVNIEFDKYSGRYASVPEFMEIEGSCEEDVFLYVKKLGLEHYTCRSWSTVEVLQHYGFKVPAF
ncbi:MAG TPA: class IV adenylate cyclase [Spirochaetota bacterium]|nr:class IV adenylate cyclase [Spirochaetota bacterium]